MSNPSRIVAAIISELDVRQWVFVNMRMDGSSIGHKDAAVVELRRLPITRPRTSTITAYLGRTGLSRPMYMPSGVSYQAGINTTLIGGNGKDILDGSAGHDILVGRQRC